MGILLFGLAPREPGLKTQAEAYVSQQAHDASFVRIAIKRAIKEAGRVPEYFHSDQGSEYLAEEILLWLKAQGVKISKSLKSSPWRNGSQESFFGRIVEFGDCNRFNSVSELCEEINQMMFYFTHLRIKNRLKIAPAEFRKKWFENIQSRSDLPRKYCHFQQAVTHIPTPLET